MDEKWLLGKKILVTGSLGFIGTHIVNRLPNSVVIKDSSNEKHIDLLNRNEVLNLKPADIVIHAASKLPQSNVNEVAFYLENNINGTLNVLKYCIKNKVKKLICLSTYVYGNPKYSPVDENHPINPHTAYTESKYLCERLCEFYNKNYNLDVIILRPFNVFGKFQRLGFLIPNLINAIQNDKEVTITNKDSKRDFLFIDDFVDLVMSILDSRIKFEIFNVGTGISYSFEEILNKIEKITNDKFKVNYIDDEKIFIKEITADISKIKKQVGWKPKMTLEEGLRTVLET